MSLLQFWVNGFPVRRLSDPYMRFCKFYGLQTFFLLCKVRSVRAIKSHGTKIERTRFFQEMRSCNFMVVQPIIISHSFFRNHHNYGSDETYESNMLVKCDRVAEF